MNTVDKDAGSTELLVALLAQKLGKEKVAKLTGLPEEKVEKVLASKAEVLATFASGKIWTPRFSKGIGIILRRLFKATRGNLRTISDVTRIPPAHLIKMGEQIPEAGGAAETPSPTNKVKFVMPVSRRGLARDDGDTGRNDCLIVTGGDKNFFGMMVDLVESIRRFPGGASYDIAVMDLGLEEAQRARLNEQGCFTIEPVDVRKNGCSLSMVHRGQISRTFLPELVPGYDQYMWMDGDTWLNDMSVIESYRQAATEYGFAITPEVSRCYDKDLTMRDTIEWHTGCYQRFFGAHLANVLGVLPVINSGVFCTRADSNVLRAWRKRIYQALSLTKEEGDDLFMLEQTAGNVAMYLDVREWAALPARYNWICSRSAPMLDKERGILVEPSPPYDPIGIVHMTYRTKKEAIAIPLRNGSLIKTSLWFRDISSYLASST